MLARDLVSAWQRLLSPHPVIHSSTNDGRAAIHHHNPISEYAAWARCRDRAQFHLGRGRRARDRGHYREGAREIERALQHDDTSEAYFQVLGQCHLNASPSNLAAARRSLERALAINPRNGYTIKLLLGLHQADGGTGAAPDTHELALEARAHPAALRDTSESYHTSPTLQQAGRAADLG